MSDQISGSAALGGAYASGAIQPSATHPRAFGGQTGNTETGSAAQDLALRTAAQAFEAAFLSEMLKHAGLGEAREGFGGGVGEAQFAGLLRDAQSDALAKNGGIGLAEHIFEAMKARANGT